MITHHGSRIGAPREAGPFVLRRIDYPAGHRSDPHAHPGASMTLVLSGEIRETTSLGEGVGSSLSVVVKPPGVRHANEYGPGGARTLQVAIRPERLASLGDSGALDDWRWLSDSPAAALLLRLARDMRRGAGAERLEEGVLEAGASLDGSGRDRDDAARGEPPGWLVRVREALDDQLEQGVTVRELARLVGAHPVSVSRAFRRHFGLTISGYRRRERIRRAAHRIATTGASLTRVAYATGHADQPHFCREFRRVAGLTPSEYRALLAG